jgi:hypothetical protein
MHMNDGLNRKGASTQWSGLENLEDRLLLSGQTLTSITPGTSAESDATAEIDSRIAGQYPAKALGLFDQTGSLTWGWNPDSWTTGMDFTSVSAANDSTGGYLGNKGGTLISARQILFTEHYAFNVGDMIDFVTSGGLTVSRTVVAVNPVPNTDLSVGLLNSDVPTGLTPASVLPADYANYFALDGGEIPVDRLNAAKQSGVWETTLIESQGASSEGTFDAFTFTHPSATLAPDRAALSTTVVSGDSGSPIFMVLDNKPVLISLVTSGSDAAFCGPVISDYITQINQVMAAQAVANGLDPASYQLSVMNLDSIGYENDFTHGNPGPTINTVHQIGGGTATLNGYHLAGQQVILDTSNLDTSQLAPSDFNFWMYETSTSSWSFVPDVTVTDEGNGRVAIGSYYLPYDVTWLQLSVNGTISGFSSSLTIPCLAGDLNGDGLVDVADYDIWAANVGQTGYGLGDANGDGLVDVADYDIWAANVGQTASSYTTPALPSQPSGLSAYAQSDGSVYLGWNWLSSNQAGFRVYASTTSGSSGFAPVATVTYPYATDCYVTGLNPNTHYWFEITAINFAGESLLPSNTSDVTTILPSPTNLTATPESSSEIDLAWSPVTAATQYGVYYYNNTTGTWNLLNTSSTNSYADTTALEGQWRDYYVVAENAQGCSQPSYVYGLALPAAPTSANATAISGHEARIGWTNNSSSNPTFVIQESLTDSTNDSDWTTIGYAYYGQTSFDTTDALDPSIQYYFRVGAENYYYGSALTFAPSGTTTAFASAAPTVTLNSVPPVTRSTLPQTFSGTADDDVFDLDPTMGIAPVILAFYSGLNSTTNLVQSAEADVDPTTGTYSTSVSLDSGDYTVVASEIDSAGQIGSSSQVNFTVDTTAPRVTGVTSTFASGSYTSGTSIPISVSFSAPVNVTGTPTLALNVAPTSRTAVYQSGNGTNTLIFAYVVQAGDKVPALDCASANALTLAGGTISDAAGNDAMLALPTPGAAGSLSAGKSLAVGMLSASLAATSAGPTNATSVQYTVAFSSSVTGVTSAAFTIHSTGLTGAAVTAVTGSGSSYTVTVNTGTGDGTLTLGLADNGSIVSAAGLKLADSTGAYPEIDGPAITIDKTAPSVPSGFIVTAVTSSSILFTWTASTDNNAGAISYQVHRFYESLPTVTTPECLDQGLTACTNYSYVVWAFDAAGNVSAASSVLSASTASATAGPTISAATNPTVNEGGVHTFDLGTLADGSGTGPWTINVAWGDGGPTDQFVATSLGDLSFAHQYMAHGTFHVVVQAIDHENHTGNGLFTNTIAYVVPTVSFDGSDSSVDEGSEFDLSLSCIDAGSNTVQGWLINWGDGTTSTAGATDAYAPHTYNVPGDYAISATVTDIDGPHPASTSVAVGSVTPVMFVSGGATVTEGGSPSTISMVGADAGNGTVASWDIDWGDGSAKQHSTGSSASHAYVAGTGIYTVTVYGNASEGGQYQAANTVDLGVLPKPATGFTATADTNDPSQMNLSWTDVSQIATGYEIEQSVDQSLYTITGYAAADATSYLVTGLTANKHYYFRLIAIDDAGQSVAATADQTTSSTQGGNVPENDDSSSSIIDIGMTLNFYGVKFSQVYVNNNGNITLGTSLITWTPSAALATGYGCPIIAPFFADVDTRNGGGTVTYQSTMVNGNKAWEVDWSNVGYFYRGEEGYWNTSNTNARDTFSLKLVDRSDIQPGDFDIVFTYAGITWDCGDASYGYHGLVGDGSHTGGYIGVDARCGYSNGTGASGTYYEPSISGSSNDGMLGVSGQTYQIRNAKVDLTAHRTGNNNGVAVSPDDQKSGDPSNYVIMVNDGYTQDSSQINNDADYNAAQIAAGHTVNLHDPNDPFLAMITLKQVTRPTGTGDGTPPPLDGTVELILSNPDSVRLYDSTGHQLTSLTATLSASGTGLASLGTGDLNIYIEGLQADPDFSLSYVYLDGSGQQSIAEVHMAIADPMLLSVDGTLYSSPTAGIDQQELATGIASSDKGTIYSLWQDIQAFGFKFSIDGLSSGEIQSVTIRSSTGASYTVQLVDGQDGAEAKYMGVFYAADGQATPVDPNQVKSDLNFDVLAAGDLYFDVVTKGGKDSATTKATTQPAAEYVNPDVKVEENAIAKWKVLIDKAKKKAKDEQDRCQAGLEKSQGLLEKAKTLQTQWNQYDAIIVAVVADYNTRFYPIIAARAKKYGYTTTPLDPALVKALIFSETRMGTDTDYKGWLADCQPTYDQWIKDHKTWVDAGSLAGKEPKLPDDFYNLNLGRVTDPSMYNSANGTYTSDDVAYKGQDIKFNVGRQLADAYSTDKTKDVELCVGALLIKLDYACWKKKVGTKEDPWKAAVRVYKGSGEDAVIRSDLVWKLYKEGTDPAPPNGNLWPGKK